MFERFTKAARATVERAPDRRPGRDGRGGAPRAPARGAARRTRTAWRSGCWPGSAPRRRSSRAVLDRPRLRYVDGLDADDAEALQAIGIDLDEVVRRIDRNLGGPSPRSAAATVQPRVQEGAGARAARGDRAAAQLHRHRAPAARPGPWGGPGRRRHAGRVRDRAGGPACGGGRRGPPRRMTRPDLATGSRHRPVPHLPVRQAGRMHPAHGSDRPRDHLAARPGPHRHLAAPRPRRRGRCPASSRASTCTARSGSASGTTGAATWTSSR